MHSQIGEHALHEGLLKVLADPLRGDSLLVAIAVLALPTRLTLVRADAIELSQPHVTRPRPIGPAGFEAVALGGKVDVAKVTPGILAKARRD